MLGTLYLVETGWGVGGGKGLKEAASVYAPQIVSHPANSREGVLRSLAGYFLLGCFPLPSQ